MRQKPYIKIENNTLLKYLPEETQGDETIVVIPNGVERIAAHIFDWEGIPRNKYTNFEAENEIWVTSIVIPSSVKEIEPEAFIDQEGLKSITVPPACDAATVIDDCLYNKDATTLLCLIDREKESVVIPEGVKKIAKSAFDNANIKSITLPSSLENIGEKAFQGCRRLQDIYIPKSIIDIEEDAFANCNATLHFSGMPQNCLVNEYGIFSKDGTVLKRAFEYSSEYAVPNGVIIIESGAFSHFRFRPVNSIVIPEGVAEIKDKTFDSLFNVMKVELPKSVKRIGDWAFVEGGFSSIDMPEGLEEIGKYAFHWCHKLQEIRIPQKVKKIDDYAFALCDILSEVFIYNPKAKLGTNVFDRCKQLKMIHIPAGAKSLIDYCQKYKLVYTEDL